MKKFFKKLFLTICGLLLSQLSYADSNYTIYDSNEVDGIYYKFDSSSGTACVSCKYKVMKKFMEEMSDPEDVWEEERTVWISSYNDCTGNIVIPSTVTYKGVTYNVTSIGDRAFAGCTGLTSVSIPEGVTEIGDSAFAGCSSLTSFQIPASVTRIERAAFNGCSGLKSLVFEDGNNNLNLSFSKWIEDTSWSNNDSFYGLFYDCPLQSIYLGRNISYSYSYSIYHYYVDYAYWITISPDTNDYVSSPFQGKSSLTQLNIGEGVTSICANLFSGCSGLTSLTLPSSIESVGTNAFAGCHGLTSVTIPNSMISIGNVAFYCSNLTTVNVVLSDNSQTSSNSQESISISAFSSCSKLNTVNVKMSDISAVSSNIVILSALPSSATWNYYLNDNLLTSLDIPSSVTSIGNYVFYNAKGITSLTLPSSLTSIGNYAFQNCSGITSVTVPNTLSATVGTDAFSGCSGIATVNTKISDISSISSDRTIMSFLPVSATWNYYLNDNLLTSLDIPSSVTSIGNYAFYKAKGITSVTMPNTLTRIGNYAFNGCTPTAFICKATTPPTLGTNNSFGGQKKIYVPYASVNAYKSKWSSLSTSSGYQYFPLLDVMFFETQSAASYASELTNKDKSQITSVAFYEGGLDNDLTESVMKAGMNPNCLYYVPASAGLSGDNIVTLDSYLAESVTLTDNYTYDCPIPFHAEELKYVHNPSVWANGSAGWETICLPFAPETFEASEQGFISPIMLGSKGNFWLRKFVGASSDAVYFSSTIDGQMEANTLYLVAFPGSTMGAGHLQGQTITFTGYDKNIQVTEQPTVKNNGFVFVGNYDQEVDGIEGWALNAAGSSFARSTSVGNQPFRAYFKNLSGQISNARLRIDFSDPTDVRSLRTASSDISLAAIGNGELVIQSKSNRPLSIYTVDGRLVRRVQLAIGENRIDGLHKGLYIVDNHKIMMR